jgi:3-hydroxybutyryl-CoA dehydrogenase
MQKIFVAGAGTMGLDIAQVFARHGMTVCVRDINNTIIETAQKRMGGNIAKLVSKGKMTQEEADAVLSRISYTVSMEPAADADLVLEAIIERIDLKKSVFKELDGICKPECIFASNTSSVSVTEMAVASGRPDRFIGMHFFNPAPVMKLIELIRALTTSDETFAAVHDLALLIGKEPVEVQDSPGFVVNRILTPMMNEAVFLLQEGVASAEDIDKAMQLGANHPMGPLHLADLIGLDVVVSICDVLFSETHDPKYRACFLLRKMVRAGKLGRKSGEGFFRY